MNLHRKPTSPGEILLYEYLIPLKISQKELAEHIGCDYKVINRIINEKAGVTPEVATKLAAALETTPDFWLNAQIALDLWETKIPRKKIPSLLRIKHRRLRTFERE